MLLQKYSAISGAVGLNTPVLDLKTQWIQKANNRWIYSACQRNNNRLTYICSTQIQCPRNFLFPNSQFVHLFYIVKNIRIKDLLVHTFANKWTVNNTVTAVCDIKFSKCSTFEYYFFFSLSITQKHLLWGQGWMGVVKDRGGSCGIQAMYSPKPRSYHQIRSLSKECMQLQVLKVVAVNLIKLWRWILSKCGGEVYQNVVVNFIKVWW